MGRDKHRSPFPWGERTRNFSWVCLTHSQRGDTSKESRMALQNWMLGKTGEGRWDDVWAAEWRLKYRRRPRLSSPADLKPDYHVYKRRHSACDQGHTENIWLADEVLRAGVYSLEECCLPIFSCVLHGLTPKTEIFSNYRLQSVYPGHTDPWCDSVAVHAAPEFLPSVASYRTQKPPPNVILPPAAPHYWADSSFRANNRWFLA